MIPLPNEARLCQRPAADINDEDFVIVAKEQQRARVPWPDAAKCYSLSPKERAGVRGKCTQYSRASQFLRFVSPPHEPKLSQCSRSNQTTSVPKGGLGGTGHWPVLAGDPPDSRARSKARDRRTFRAQDSAASCRRGRPSWPCHPEQRHPVWQVHGFKAQTAVRRILTLNPSPQRRGKQVIPPKQSSGFLAAALSHPRSKVFSG